MNLKILLLPILLAGCTFTTTKTKDPVFKTDQSKIAGNLIDIVDCEKIDIYGTEDIENGNKTSVLSIKIINGKNLPSQNEELELLGKRITFKLIENLADIDQFDEFELYFVTQKKNGALTTNQSERFVYQLTPPVNSPK